MITDLHDLIPTPIFSPYVIFSLEQLLDRNKSQYPKDSAYKTMESYQSSPRCMLCSGGIDLPAWTKEFITGIFIILFY